MKKCPYCKTQFIPHPKVGKRQITCGEPAGKAIRNMWKRTVMHKRCVTGEKSSILIYVPS